MHVTRFVCSVLFCATFGISHLSGRAHARDQSSSDLFKLLISAEGTRYFELRNDIVGQGGAAVPFLQGQRTNEDLRARVLSGAVLSWISESESNLLRARTLGDLVREASRHQAGMLRTLQGMSFGTWGSLNGPVPRGDALDDPAAAPFLLEAALKGIAPSPGQKEAYGGIWVRSLAAGLLGGLPDPDVLPVLRELVRDERFEIRACACTGLRRLKTPESTETLIITLSDKNQEVRRTCRGGVVDATDQDFGEDQEKWIAWWRENKSKWPFNDRKPGAKMLLIK